MSRITKNAIRTGLTFGLTAAMATACTGGEQNPGGGSDKSFAPTTPPAATASEAAGPACDQENLYRGVYSVRYVGAAGIILDQKKATQVTFGAARAAHDFLRKNAGIEQAVTVGGTAVAYGTQEQYDRAHGDGDYADVMWTMSRQAADAVMNVAAVEYGLPQGTVPVEPAVALGTASRSLPLPEATVETGWMAIEVMGTAGCNQTPQP